MGVAVAPGPGVAVGPDGPGVLVMVGVTDAVVAADGVLVAVAPVGVEVGPVGVEVTVAVWADVTGAITAAARAAANAALAS